jgi:hypothetical protein
LDPGPAILANQPEPAVITEATIEAIALGFMGFLQGHKFPVGGTGINKLLK